MMELAQLYWGSHREKVNDLDLDLQKELDELKTEIDENNMSHQIPSRTISSVTLPKDVNYFKRERKLVIDRIVQVSEAQPLKMQADLMREEMMISEDYEYSPSGLPLLLHQHFLERIQQLINCKYLHMLRWKRFCEHTSTIEALYPMYTKRLNQILLEYNDCVQRAQRLGLAREAMLCNNESGQSVVKQDDLLIYLRWLVCHLHSLKRVNQYLKIVQWMPVQHKTEISVPDKEKDESAESSSAAKIASRYQDDNLGLFQRPKSGSSRPPSASTPYTSTPIPQPPSINPTLLSTTPLPTSVFTYAAAASGGGIATDESTLGLPVNAIDFETLKPHLNFLLNIYGITYDLHTIRTSADEMELYAAVSRKFRQFFMRQETMKTYHTYDRIELGQEGWGTDSPIHALRKDSNWVDFIKIKPVRDPAQEKRWTQLRQSKNEDELLKMMAHLLHIGDPEKVQDVLRDHTAMVCSPSQPRAADVRSHRTQYNTMSQWRKIYRNPDLYSETEADESLLPEDMDERDIENVKLEELRNSKIRKRKDSYDYVNTKQMLGLEDDDADHKDVSTVQGAYLSFLLLRHLRLRDLQRTALSVLNYFRSLERTLTINDAGLSQEDDQFKVVTPQNHRRSTEHEGIVGGGGGLANHGYLHNTPADFKINEAEFIEFSEVENHDDFYMIDEGRIHVQDQRGYYIIYDAAEKDLKKLQEDLMLIATLYIEKDKDLRDRPLKGTESARRRPQSMPGDFDIAQYAHQDIDRFGIWLDLWTNETAFLECKRELIDCYYEAYQHIYDRDEKRALAQVITNIMYKRPRFDFTSDYFIKTYRTECVILRQMKYLLKCILDKQIEEEREYNQKVCRDGDTDFGLPHRIIPKHPISVNLSRPALKNVFMLEFHPSLCIASRIPEALSYALQELVHIHRPENVYDALQLEKKLLEVAQREWDQMPKPGLSYSVQVQKDLFSDVFVDDPLFMCEIVQHMMTEDEQVVARKSPKEKQTAMLHIYGRMLEAITLRFRVIDCAWETEILSKIYKKQAAEMGFTEYHLYIRVEPFEGAHHKDDAGKPPPISMASALEDDVPVDKYPTTCLRLAIHEIDEAHIGRFTFRSRDGLLNILRPGHIENLQVVLKTQIVHKNALMCAVQQVHVCVPVREMDSYKTGRASPTETKSEKSSVTQLTGISSGTGGTALGSKHHSDSGGHSKRSPDSFVSIQFEKSPSRDLMLNDYVLKKNTLGTVLRNTDELSKVKRSLITDFCYIFNRRMTQYSIRGQLISYYNSILRLLEDFPSVRETYFMLGEPFEKKTNVDGPDNLIPDPKTSRKRPRQLLSNDGKHVLNIWFIPHHTEALVMFKKLSDESCVSALSYSLLIVSSLHDILQYLCAHSRLGSSHARLGTRKMEFVSADWGGTEGIGSELREIQKQIDNLPVRTDPQSVAEFLSLRRDVMFLEFDTAVRHSMSDTFLSTGNLQAFKSIQNNIHHALPSLSNIQKATLGACHLNVPEPLEPRDIQARELYPWRAFLGRNGPFPMMFWQWHLIEFNIQLCLAGLKDVDRHVANGEILGVTLLMEDVLQSGYMENLGEEEPPDSPKSEKKSAKSSSKAPSRAASRMDLHRSSPTDSGKTVVQRSLNRTQEPIESYKLLKFFLMLWKCLEYVKNDWGKRKFMVEQIDDTNLYKDFCKAYKSEILLPVLQSVARRLGRGEMYEGIELDTDPLVMPKGASEIEVRSQQMIKLLETFECHMITEIRKKIAKELTLAVAERAREEPAEPTDLWKRPVMKESFTLAKPHVAESFVLKLMEECEETDDKFVFTKEHLNSCVAELARSVMAREKHNFESYTMYYENLLRVHHQLLYQSEQEVKNLKQQVKQSQGNVTVEVKCQLANYAHDLLMEITALRAKIAEMREMSLTQETDIRDRVRQEYEDLIENLFECSTKLKDKFDDFREELHDDVVEKINKAKWATLEEFKTVREKAQEDADDLMAERDFARTEQLRDLQHENHSLNMLVLKMKAMNNWTQNHNNVKHKKIVTQIQNGADNSKKEKIELKMVAEENITLLMQQLVSVRKALAAAEKECNEIRKQLDKELKEKMEKTHEAIQRARSQKQLEQAKQANIEKLIDELENRDTRLKIMTEEQDKSQKLQLITQEKIRRDMDGIKKQLSHERTLKLDAFGRVDELQTQVYDLETCVINRSQSAITFSPSATTRRSSSRAQSAKRSVASHATTTTGVWPPPVSWPANRSLTPAPGKEDYLNNYQDPKKIQRPKTVGGRLRSRIAEQLINELELDQQRAIIQLEELQLESGRSKDKCY